jgi:ABC-type transport system involved in cytochrome bd biosynthesis fused ATPase/permease subunit
MRRIAELRNLVKFPSAQPLFKVITRFALFKALAFVVGSLALSFLAAALVEEPTLRPETSTAALVFLLAFVCQAALISMSERSIGASSHALIKSARSRAAEDLLESPPAELGQEDVDHIMARVLDHPKSLREYLTKAVPATLDLLLTLLLSTITLASLLIASSPTESLLTFTMLLFIKSAWSLLDLHGATGIEMRLDDLLDSGDQEAADPDRGEDSQGSASLGRIKEMRWTDCEIVIDEDHVVTFPWGIASAGKLTLVQGLGHNAKTALVETIIGIRSPNQGRLFLETSKGTFRFDALDHSQLRGSIGWLPKDPNFIAGTIEENFRLIKPRANREKFKEILTKVGLTEESLPDGVKTRVDQGNLTKAQLRKLALARILLKEAPVVLAEDDSSIEDGDLRTLINETLKTLAREGEMVIAVSDDQELKGLADRVLKIDSESFTPTFVLESAQ